MTTTKGYRQQWIQDRINELLGPRRMGYAEIARKTGVTKQYVHQIAGGGPASDAWVAALCEAFGFDPPHPPGTTPVLDPVKSPTSSAVVPGDRTQELLERIEKALAEQSTLLRTLTELVLARKG